MAKAREEFASWNQESRIPFAEMNSFLVSPVGFQGNLTEQRFGFFAGDLT